MNNYIGSKCISCGEAFKEGDDIVVCPECGTPYHRECYLNEGKCINTELHERQESWQPENDEKSSFEANDGEPIRCIRCGEENPADGIFCKKCGMPLTRNRDEERPFNVPPQFNNGANTNQNNGQQNFGGGFYGGAPFGMGQQMTFDQDSDIDGVKLGDYAKFVGRNPVGMLSNFIRFGKFGGKGSLNIGALFFPQFYFFYRKMPALGALFMLIAVACSIPGLIVTGQSDIMGMVLLHTNFDVNSSMFNLIYNVTSVLSMASRCIAAVFANYWYYKYAKKTITDIRSEALDDETAKAKITVKGGTSMAALVMSFIIYSALGTLVMFLMNMLLA